MVIEICEIWYSSSTFKRAFSWYPWCQNRTSGTFLKNFFEEPDPLILIPYDASDDGDEKHKFQRFWTWDFENGVKVTLGTTLDDLYKENSSILALFFRY